MKNYNRLKAIDPSQPAHASSLTAVSAIVLTGLSGCSHLPADMHPYITTKQPTVLLSVNDGENAGWYNGDPALMRTPDSVTVYRLSNDGPPKIHTVYGTTSSTIYGSPYAAIVKRFGIITNHDFRAHQVTPREVAGANQIVAIDLESDDLAVTSRIETGARPSLAIAHPDGRRVVVSLDDGWRVFEVSDDGSLGEIARSPTPGRVSSFALSSDGRTIVAAMADGKERSSVRERIFRFKINNDSSIAVDREIAPGPFKIDGPFSPRISPDGTYALMLNGSGSPDGVLDDVLVIDLGDNRITDAIPQVGDGLESLAIHPSGKFAVVTCLDYYGEGKTSHLAVVRVNPRSGQLLYNLPVGRIPEGIEFTADGTKLFVGATEASHLDVFDVVGEKLVRSPYVLPTGPGHSLLGIKTN